MAHEDHDAFESLLAFRGVTRRDFLKFCGSVAALLGLSESMIPQIAAAVEQGAKLKPALWINGGACTGCTESMAQADHPDVATIVLDILSINAFETISMAQGDDAEKAIEMTIEEAKADPENKGYVLIYEGSVMRGENGNTLRVAGHAQIDVLGEYAENAEAVIAVGSCAVDGGWVAAAPNPADATGIMQFLKDEGVDTPVINLPTCPVNPEWVVATVINVLILGRLPEMDSFNRPTLIFGQSIHDNCPRRGHFENGDFVREFGSKEEALGYCLYAVGCKGPQTFTNCPIVRWNKRASWCVESGSPCIGCGVTSPTPGGNWVDTGAPFLNRHRDIRIGDMITQPTIVSAAVGAAAAAALVVHGIGMKATGRMDGGAPYEDMKEHDRKKGGGK
ncbi:MAG: hydrogenase small subunit [Coriobacteriia bacterium]|nr:hydrogenase small subunit [Coriobacteriia bacterium]